jgi:malic enzyme
MSDMVRKQIYLNKRQISAVQRKAALLGINESEVIRQAIERDMHSGGVIIPQADPSAWTEIEAFLAAHAGEPLAGEPYQFNRDALYDERLDRYDESNPD